jgi:PPOX class probable F420-dependent enzyme
MLGEAERRVIETARVARLATADATGRPHVVPICYALLTDDASPMLVTPIDEKPKTAEPNDLRRVRDIRANGAVAVVIDRYSEHWDRLGWLQLRGTASVHDRADDGYTAAVRALRQRYDQYVGHALEDRPMIRIRIGSVSAWGELGAFDDD